MENMKNDNHPKRKLIYNFVTLCLIWLFVFTAYSGLQNLEAAVNADIGLYSLAAVTSGGVVSCLLAPTIISFIGSKGALVIACIGQCIFVVANFYPEPEILISAGAVTGLSSGLLWTAQSCYVTMISAEYHHLNGEPIETLLSRFFGIFFMAFQSTQVWGNLISSVVFQQGDSSTQQTNNSFCGAQFCPSDITASEPNSTSDAISKPSEDLKTLLIGIYLGFTVIGLLLTIFALRPITSNVSDNYTTIKERLLANVRLLFTNGDMAMIMPFALYTGMGQALMFAEFTTAYTACKLGVEWIGYTMICFGVCDTVGSLFAAIIAKYTGRLVLFITATILNAGVLIFLRLWAMDGVVPFGLFFIIPALWGLSDAVWQSQSDALVGAIFHQTPEVAFSNFLMFQALGLAMAYIYNIHLCEYVRLYILGSVLMLTIIFICIVEIRIKRRNKMDHNK